MSPSGRKNTEHLLGSDNGTLLKVKNDNRLAGAAGFTGNLSKMTFVAQTDFSPKGC